MEFNALKMSLISKNIDLNLLKIKGNKTILKIEDKEVELIVEDGKLKGKLI